MERESGKRYYQTAFGMGLVCVGSRSIQSEADTHPRKDVSNLTILGAKGRRSGVVRNRRGPLDGRARIRWTTGREDVSGIWRGPSK